MAGQVHPIVSSGEQRYIEDGVLEGIRADGRSLLEFRFNRISCGIAPAANGSARVQVLQGGSDVLAIVKAELDAPSSSAPLQGSVGVGVQFWASALRSFSGKPATEAAAQIEANVEDMINTPGCMNLAGLCVHPGKYAWRIWVDIVVLGIGGSLVDTCGLAAFAALNDTSLPRLRVVVVEPMDDGKPMKGSDALNALLEEMDGPAGQADPGSKSAVSSQSPAMAGAGAGAGGAGPDAAGNSGSEMDYDVELVGDVTDGISLDAATGAGTLPIPLTLARVGGRWIADATAEEEAVATARVLVGLQEGGGVARIETLAPLQGCSSSGSGSRASDAVPGKASWQGVMDTREIAIAAETASAAAAGVFQSVRAALKVAKAGEADAAGDAELTTFGHRLPVVALSSAAPGWGRDAARQDPMTDEQLQHRLDLASS